MKSQLLSVYKKQVSLQNSSQRLWHSLVKEKGYINGQWVAAASGKTFPVHNPANGEKIAAVTDMDVTDTQKAIEVAFTAFQSWKNTLAKERSVLLRRWFELCMKNQEDLAKLLTAEQGKPLAESRGEVAYGASFLEWFSEEARREYGDYLPPVAKTKEMIFIRQPIGVAALVTPWNFPNAMILRKVGAALASGCTCIIKPAEDTPLSALALAELAEKAGIPPGVVNVVTCSRGNVADVGKLLCESSLIAGVSFTGSTAVGKILYRQCSSTVKRVSLELGGNAPFVVFKSANIDAAVAGAVASKFRNCGQTCVSTNRILVQKEVHDEFVSKLKQTMETKLKIGDGFDPATVMGPLINKQQLATVESHVADASSKGAAVVAGGERDSRGELYYKPTLLTNVTPQMKAFTDETFGPVASVVKFDTEEEALILANSTNKGLAGYFYSQDISQIWRVAKQLEVGMVGVNEGLLSTAEGAFGGVKESGIGREGSKYGTEEYTYIKYICFGITP